MGRKLFVCLDKQCSLEQCRTLLVTALHLGHAGFIRPLYLRIHTFPSAGLPLFSKQQLYTSINHNGVCERDWMISGERSIEGSRYTTLALNEPTEWIGLDSQVNTTYLMHLKEMVVSTDVSRDVLFRCWGLLHLAVDNSLRPQWIFREFDPASHRYGLLGAISIGVSVVRNNMLSARITFSTTSLAWNPDAWNWDSENEVYLPRESMAIPRANSQMLASYLAQVCQTTAPGSWNVEFDSEGGAGMRRLVQEEIERVFVVVPPEK